MPRMMNTKPLISSTRLAAKKALSSLRDQGRQKGHRAVRQAVMPSRQQRARAEATGEQSRRLAEGLTCQT